MRMAAGSVLSQWTCLASMRQTYAVQLPRISTKLTRLAGLFRPIR